MFQSTLRLTAAACFTTALSVLFIGAIAIAAPNPPDAGQVLQGAQTALPQPPGSQLPNVTITNGSDTATSDTGGPTVTVASFTITGADVVKPGVLTGIIQDSVGKSLTLGQLREAAARLTRYLRAHGYLVARAYVPDQQVVGGVVAINVIIGRYGAIDIENTSSVSSAYLRSIIRPLQVGDVIEQGKLERTLLLLTDVSGAKVTSTLSAGSAPGTSSLTIQITNDEKVRGKLSEDNWGDKFTGQWRTGVNLLINNVTGNGDAINLGDLYAGGGLNDYDAGYALPTGPCGAKLNLGYSRVSYALGGQYSSIGATGIADVSSISESYPIIRSRSLNLNGQFGYDSKILKDEIAEIVSDSRKKDGVVDLELNGSSKDPEGNGYTTFDFAYNEGKLTLDSPAAVTNDTLGTKGDWNKETLTVVRDKYFAQKLSYYVSFDGQLADKNLDSSEQLILGGATGVRAYPQGEAPGDEGYIATGEIRWDLPTPALQLAAFGDSGSVEENKNPLVSAGNTVHLADVGLGIIASPGNGYKLRLDYAVKVTNYRATSDANENGRAWLSLSKEF
jgi:hemolysin activation/secretion protein